MPDGHTPPATAAVTAAAATASLVAAAAPFPAGDGSSTRSPRPALPPPPQPCRRRAWSLATGPSLPPDPSRPLFECGAPSRQAAPAPSVGGADRGGWDGRLRRPPRRPRAWRGGGLAGRQPSWRAANQIGWLAGVAAGGGRRVGLMLVGERGGTGWRCSLPTIRLLLSSLFLPPERVRLCQRRDGTVFKAHRPAIKKRRLGRTRRTRTTSSSPRARDRLPSHAGRPPPGHAQRPTRRFAHVRVVRSHVPTVGNGRVMAQWL